VTRGGPSIAFEPEPNVISQTVLVGNPLCAKHELTGSVRSTVLHMTICAIGSFPMPPEGRVETALEVANRLVAKPLEMTLNRVRIFEREGKPPLVALADHGVSRMELFRYALIADLLIHSITAKAGMSCWGNGRCAVELHRCWGGTA
jgi:hypothetical protein